MTLDPADIVLPDREIAAIAAGLDDRWWEIALCTDRCDRPAAEAAVRASYRAAGLPSPDVVVWMESPRGVGFARDRFFCLRHGDGQRVGHGQVGHEVMAGCAVSPGYRVPPTGALGKRPTTNQVLEGLGIPWPTARLHAIANVGHGMGYEFFRSFGVDRDSRLLRRYDEEFSVALPRGVRIQPPFARVVYGHSDIAHQGPWRDAEGLARCALEWAMVGREPPPTLSAVTEAVAGTGWWEALDRIAVLSERPTVISLDEDLALHGENGPALAYADGYSWSRWHGVAVPGDLVLGEGWGPEKILAEHDGLVRQCALEKRGWDRFVQEAGLRPVGEAAPDPSHPGRVLRLFELPERLREFTGLADWEMPVLHEVSPLSDDDNSLAVRVLRIDAAAGDDGMGRPWAVVLVPAHERDPARAMRRISGFSQIEYLALERGPLVIQDR